MKLSIIGFGQCGCNIADEFYAVNNYAKSILNGRIEILTDAFAINTDETDLGGFKHIPRDRGHRILIGNMATFGHGVGKINVDAANIIKSCNSAVIDTILRSRKFHESDAVMAIASGGGGTGSGTIGWVVKTLKERIDKPVYALIVLPFAFEEKGNSSYAVMNAASSINTLNRYADAVFLVDNERFRKTGSNLAQNLAGINREIARSFYDLCCAGEEKRQKYVGSKVIDAGDIKQSLNGISVIGRGEVALPTFLWNKNHFREGIREQGAVLGALRQAENNSGMSFNPEDARKILVLFSAPKDAIDVTTLEQASHFLHDRSPNAVVRIGDYPRRGREISVTLMASQLTRVPRLERLFTQAEYLFKKQQAIGRETGETETQIDWLKEFTKGIPTLD